jgi:hypothetical protein
LIISYQFEIGSAVGLMRLQDTYKLNTSEVANGEISSNFKSRKLSGKEKRKFFNSILFIS